MDAQVFQPETLMEAVKYFSDPLTCHEYMVKMRWPNGVTCIHCGSNRLGFLASRLKFQCKNCRKQFTVKVGTIFEDSPIGLDKWLVAAWMISNCRKGVSSCEIGREVGVCQKTAWFMLHRIRLAMQDEEANKLSGIVEVDETFIDGKARFMHKKPREKKYPPSGQSCRNGLTGALRKD